MEKSNTNDSSNSTKKINNNETNLKDVLPKLNKSVIKKQDSFTEAIDVNEKLSQKTLNRSKNSSKLIIETITNQRNLSQQSNTNNSNANAANNKSQNSPKIDEKLEKSELNNQKEEYEEKISLEKEKVLSDSSKLSKKSLKSMPDLDQIEYKNDILKIKSSIAKIPEQDDEFSHIRVVRSYEDKDLRQNIDQFDIEYMCRCLGLALMKHLESSKDKTHIIELINTKEKFDFFNTIFNINFDFFNTFFNMENKISNLEKLDDYFKLNEGNKLDIKYFQDEDKLKSKKVPNPHISYFSHMKYTNEKIAEVDNCLIEKSTILGGDLSKIEKIDIPEEIINENIEFDEEMKTINEFFKGQQNKSAINNNKYKNLCEKTKVILTQDLSAIKEVDSVDYVNKNLLQTVEKNKQKKPTTEYIDLLQDSATHFFTENDPKKLEEFNKVFHYLTRLL